MQKKRSQPSGAEISNTRIRGGGEEEEDEMKIQREINNEEQKEEEEELGFGFYACYLLASLSPRYKGHSYIGFTINPRRRIRQHNGEITSGAWKTKLKRPWEMVLCIYGFPTNVSALQFEWAWQHPTESLSVRSAAATFKSLCGIANKIKLAYAMLTLPTWQGMNLTVNFFSTKYTKHSAGCPDLPRHMEVQVCPMDDLPCYVEGNQNLRKNGKGNVSDWYEDEECDRSGSPNEYKQEGFADTTVQYSAVNQSGIESTSKEKFGQSEENGVRQTMEPITLKDHTVGFCSADSLSKASSSIPTLVQYSLVNQSGIESTSKEKFGQSEENVVRQTVEPITLKDRKDGFCSAESLSKADSSIPSVVRYSAVTQSGVESKWNEKFGQSEENGVRQTMEPITLEDHKEGFCSADSLSKAFPSIPSLVFSDEIIAGRRVEVQGGLQHGRLPRKPISGCSVIASEVEVIDISTPSPDFPSCTKKRRDPAAHPLIIDLTRSPIFVQL